MKRQIFIHSDGELLEFILYFFLEEKEEKKRKIYKKEKVN